LCFLEGGEKNGVIPGAVKARVKEEQVYVCYNILNQNLFAI